MKLKTIICSFSFITLGLNTSNNLITNENPNLKYQFLKESISSWSDAECSLDFSFDYNDEKYLLYTMKKGNDLKGYFLANSKSKIETIYVGNQKNDDYSNLSDISPLFSKGEYCENQNNKNSYNINEISEYSFLKVPQLNTKLYKTESTSFSSEQIIKDCPTYFNPTNYMCTPTAAAMLISFYDRYSSLTNLVDGLLPLNHNENKSKVNELIDELSSFMGTTSGHGTYLYEREDGINMFLSSRGYKSYKVDTLTNYDLYSTLINTYNQPAIVGIEYGKVNHSVLGIGTANIRYSGNYLICHYGESQKNLGDYYLPSDYFVNATYIGR